MIREISEVGFATPVLDCDGLPIHIGDVLVAQNGGRVYVVSMAWEEFPGYWHLQAPSQSVTMSGRPGEGNFYHLHSHPAGALIANVHVDRGEKSDLRISRELNKRFQTVEVA